MSVVCHAPCRPWSAHCAHQAKPEPGEKELGPFCAEMLRKWGGGTGTSGAFPAIRGGQSSEARQWQWRPVDDGSLASMVGIPDAQGDVALLPGISPNEIRVPFALHPRGMDRRTEQSTEKRLTLCDNAADGHLSGRWGATCRRA